MNKLKTIAIAAGFAAASVTGATTAFADELSLAYFMGPKHPMNKGVMTPFGERLAELSGGKLTVKQFPGGALNKVPPKQYSILLDGVADIIFTLPGYTADVFPKTNVVGLPGVCDTALACTEALQRVRPELEKEYNAKVLAIWTNGPAVLITRDKAVRSLEDMQGLKVRVTSKSDVPFVEALGASAVAQPVTVINQNLANGVIDAIMIDPSAIGSFKLHEPANYVTTWFPGSGSAFVLLMNKDVYDGLSDEEKGWVDQAADETLSLNAGKAYDAAWARGLKIAEEAGNEMIELSDAEKAKFQAKIDEVMAKLKNEKVGDSTIGEMIAKMKGEKSS
ncbi:MAG: TRAP transporter substrate-binding protein [Alphaproteobacteria bacterium]|nr:TRAP transporter substrate-binding protein [Alphaproteobacteria bacterium]